MGEVNNDNRSTAKNNIPALIYHVGLSQTKKVADCIEKKYLQCPITYKNM